MEVCEPPNAVPPLFLGIIEEEMVKHDETLVEVFQVHVIFVKHTL